MNRKNISTVVLAVGLMLSSAQAFPEDLFKLGIVDMTKVVNVYYQESPAIRDLQKYWSDTETELEKMNQEIRTLESKLAQAKQAGNSSEALSYERTISEKKSYLNEYYRVHRTEYERRYENLSKTSEFFNQLLSAIKFIATRDSFTLILKSTDPSIMYYSKDIDITADVIEYLKK